MNQDEAASLLEYTKKYKPVTDLHDFAEWRGLNYWYAFPE